MKQAATIKRSVGDSVLARIVRTSCLQLALAVAFSSMALAIPVKGQDVLERRVTIQVTDVPLDNILLQLEKSAQVRFSYNSRMLQVGRLVSINAQNESLSAILDKMLKPLKIRYLLVSNRIVLRRFDSPRTDLLDETVLSDLPTVVATADQTVSGLVSDQNGQALAGVSVIIKGTQKGTTSDEKGRYRLVVPDQNLGNGDAASRPLVLAFSFVGYLAQEITVGNRTQIDVTLTVDNKSLDEVVVVGYGTVRKSDLTGSVSSIKGDQLTAYPATGVVQALQGRAPGVQIQANNGDPGGAFKIRIRGGTSINASSDPIFVIDGFVGGVLPPPEDIESIEVLKDASATAIYGSRGANGVVMVTTKQGKAGKPRIEFNSSYSAQNEINRLQLLDADQYTAYVREITPTYQSPGGNTDWQDQIFRQGGIQNHQLSFSGGTDAIKYYLSGAFFDQNGIIVGTSFKRYSVRNNLSFKVNNRIQIGMNLFAQRSGRKGTVTQEGSGGIAGTGAVASALKFMPNQGVYNPDGTFAVALQGDPIDNPFAIISELQQESVNDQVLANFSADFDILTSLKFRTTFGASINNQRAGTFYPTTLNQGRNTGGDARIEGDKNTNLINENYLTYNRQFGGAHNLTVLGGYSYQRFSNESWGGRSQSFITNTVSYWNLGSGSVFQAPNSNLSGSVLSSLFGRVNYSFNDRYLFTANARYDGSSNFSKNQKWAFFPSGAFAWNMTNEEFMKNVRFVSTWKWRVSYGLTGNQAISPFQTLARFSSLLAVINGKQVNAVRPTTVANDDLTWETTAQFDIGTDISFLNNRVNLTLDYYQRTTSDLLFSVPLPQYSGYQTQLKNIGKVENRGVEVGLNTKILTGAFKWNADVNVAANRNKILELPNGTDIQYGAGPGHMIGLGNTNMLRVGQPVGSFFGWVYDGVYQTTDTFLPGAGFETTAGGEKYRDIDGKKDANGNLTGQPDGLLNTDDRMIIGNPNPKFIWGINSDVSWKNFDLNLFFQGSQGNDLLSFTLLEIESMGGPFNSTTRALDRWTPTNPNTNVPRRSASRPQRVSTQWVYDGSFGRLKNLALGYTLPASLLRKAGLQKVRIYASAQNILTFTNYPGYDPEVNYNTDGGTNSNRNLGLDYGSYPNAKSYTVGLNIGF